MKTLKRFFSSAFLKGATSILCIFGRPGAANPAGFSGEDLTSLKKDWCAVGSDIRKVISRS